ncbi:mannose-6-phosphate isomerase, type 1 [Saccharicrinis carchari]|uniref:Phosphohexomutase n=1 Tax=Saccharicrinis carchari TaxID=1168039 RepID=A0A521CH55_SACCC|nr:type I phosphomannose isomerase catalytic subunit [Saccharicrinis carchari]SMO58783.1 mannose-6-phosphate isomerase, type 1 [Saccharicrinis carchari]
MSTPLYPIKFTPILKDKIWGGEKLKNVLNKKSELNNIGESWELSGVEGDVSVVANGFLAGNSLQEIIEIYMDELVGEPVYKRFGNEFPLLFKFIDANDHLSIQVHPDDALSKERHNAYGKTEMWYVLQAEPNSQLISGFVKETNKEEYLEALNNGKIMSLLKSHQVAEGDTFFIPAGDVHAIGAGVLLAEIQQTSDVTYRIYDYDRTDSAGNTRELHTDLALDAIDYKDTNEKVSYPEDKNKAVNLATCQFFETNILDLNKTYVRDVYVLNSFVVYMCVGGSATITCGNAEKETIAKGETILIPAAIDTVTIEPKGEVKLLEVYVNQK